MEAAGARGATTDEEAGKAAKAAGKDPKETAAHGKKKAAEKKVEAAEEQTVTARDQLAEVKAKKADAEAKADHEPDAAKAKTAGKEAEARATEERALEQHVEKKSEETEKIDDAKEADITVKEVSHAEDLIHYDGDEVTLVGIYMPRPAEAGGPSLGHASLMIGNMEVHLGKDIRSTAEIVRLAGERVAVTGKLDLMKQAGGNTLDPARREKPVLTHFQAPHRR